MKQIILLCVIFASVSCTKEKKEPGSLVGTWSLTEISSGTTSPIYLNGNELAVEFKDDGCFDILGPKPNYTFLQDFNQYEVLNGNRIRFFNSTTQEQLHAIFEVNKSLSFSYELSFPYQEKFNRR